MGLSVHSEAAAEPWGAGRAGWLRAERPARYSEVLRRHLPWAAGAGLILAVLFFWPLEKLPIRRCMWRALTGYPCATCGYTRGMSAVAHGRLKDAARDCPAALAAFAALVLVFLWNTAALVSGRTLEFGGAMRLNSRAWWLAAAAALLLVAANWIYRLAMGFK